MKIKLLDFSMFEEKMWGNTYSALKSLIENCYYAQASYPFPYDDYCQHLGYYKEFCTVKMQTARRSGHTSALCKVAYEYFNKVLILTYNQDMAQRLKGVFPNATKTILPTKAKLEVGVEFPLKGYGNGKMRNVIRINGNQDYYFETVNNVDKLRGMEFEAIFVDCAFALSKIKENQIYESLGPCMNRYQEKFFIFVE